MGAVRPQFPSKPPKIESPCIPGSKHDFKEVQRQAAATKVRGDYIVLRRCLHCANSIYIQTKPYTRYLFKPMSKKQLAAQG